MTVKGTPLLACPATLTMILPEVAPEGTGTVMLEALQLLAVPAETPLNVTVLAPCEAPKLVPAMVTGVPAGALFGVTLAMLAAGGTTVIVALADFVGSEMDVAVRVTVGGLGMADGAT